MGNNLKQELIDTIIGADVSLYGSDGKSYAEVYADAILKAGWLKHICNVGATAYVIENGSIIVGEVVEIEEQKEPETVLANAPIKKTYYVNTARTLFGYELTPFTDSDFDVTVFVGEDAKSKVQQKLKENEGNKDA